MKNKINPALKAFSLIELSIALMVIGIITAGLVSVIKVNTLSDKYKITKDRMNAIDKAIVNYVAANRRLPCPANSNLLPTNNNFGKAETIDGTCSGFGSSSTPDSSYSNLVYGMVPTTALGLSSEMAADGFDTKFSYVVDKRMTKTTLNASSSSADGFEYTAATLQGNTQLPTGDNTSLITIKNDSSSGTSITDLALYVIISHGPNKLGGYNLNSTSQNSNSSNLAEVDNSYSTSFDNIFVANSTTSGFDDMLSYKTKLQLVYDAGLKFIICSGAESRLTGLSNNNRTATWPNEYYNKNATGSCASPGTGSPLRPCQAYGQWGDIITSPACAT